MKAFQILAKVVRITNERSKVDEITQNENSTFELGEYPIESIQNHRFAFLHSELRRGGDSNPR